MTDRSLIALKRRAERGKLFVVSAPSGSGKSTLVRMLLKVEPACALSISYTTRAPRSNEQEGVDYYFISRETFDQMISDGAFVEWAEVHGNRYGTSFHEIERLLEAGHDVLFDIDYQGARALKACYPEATLLLLLPPTMAELKRRLRKRGTDTAEVIERRWHAAWRELEHYGIFDFVVVNDNLQQALGELQSIYRAEQNLWWRRAYHVEMLLKEKPEAVEHD